MELFFDTFEAQTDVRVETNKIVQLLDINSELHAPPILRVAWASLQFRCVLARASQKFILFLPDGTPVRARLNVSFSEYIDPNQESKQINRQTANFTKIHVVQQGETLSDIAGRLYKNPQLWRPIAIVNDTENPRSLQTGQELQIPPLPFVNPETGEVIQ
jgi:LysM repeat protein